MTRKHLRFERTYRATPQDLWELWTTKRGIESWWGPGGFSVTVHQLDLRPGGELLYDMTAVEPEKVAFMKSAGMPVTTQARISYTEIVPQSRLAYVHVADFIPGVEPYDVNHVVEFHAEADGQVRMVVTIEEMHDELWTRRAAAGWEEELEKLDAAIAPLDRMRASIERS